MRAIGIGAAIVASAVVVGAGQSGKSVWDGAYSDAQAGRGKKDYIAHCAACHQEGMQGADLAPALKGDEFLLRWNDKSMFELVDRITKTMPQDAPGSLSPQVNADITAYMLQVNRFPAGMSDLPADEAAQKTITIIKK
jgi:cytochrome c